jgi:hypothetical protein
MPKIGQADLGELVHEFLQPTDALRYYSETEKTTTDFQRRSETFVCSRPLIYPTAATA